MAVMTDDDVAGSLARLCEVVQRARLFFHLRFEMVRWKIVVAVYIDDLGRDSDENLEDWQQDALRVSATSPEWAAAIALEKLPRYAEMMERGAEQRLNGERDLVQRLRGLR